MQLLHSRKSSLLDGTVHDVLCAKGNPIIIGINGGTWINAGGYNYHWMTILGIKEDGSIFVGDPGGSYRDGWVKWSDFGGKYTAEIGVYLVCRKK